MNPRLVSQLNGLMAKYLKEYDRFEFKDSRYAMFELGYRIYYKPLKTHILPDIIHDIKSNHLIDFSHYEKLIHPNYRLSVIEDMQENRKVGVEFLKKLSQDLTSDFNKLLMSYQKMDEKLREHFLNQFIKNRTKALVMLIENDPVLAIRTIANLRCPRLQFYFVNKLPEPSINLVTEFLNNRCQETFLGILSEYFFYPYETEPSVYYAKWEGVSRIHIKFCKKMLGTRYVHAKKFLKSKHRFEKYNDKIEVNK